MSVSFTSNSKLRHFVTYTFRGLFGEETCTVAIEGCMITTRYADYVSAINAYFGRTIIKDIKQIDGSYIASKPMDGEQVFEIVKLGQEA